MSITGECIPIYKQFMSDVAGIFMRHGIPLYYRTAISQNPYDAITDSSSPEEPYQTEKTSSESIFSSIIPDKLSGSICTAVIFMLGWKLLANKR
ncbi:hypothetical protein RR48_07211 [Papilio machaon]|uniref:Uncharacterized protein n=1 Tax=Papilio machaon TaxID=76193 RepID=A0A194RJJ7_PAPMA|nr:hypothetical protein RR48_07211 [Papilio machaon]